MLTAVVCSGTDVRDGRGEGLVGLVVGEVGPEALKGSGLADGCEAWVWRPEDHRLVVRRTRGCACATSPLLPPQRPEAWGIRP